MINPLSLEVQKAVRKINAPGRISVNWSHVRESWVEVYAGTVIRRLAPEEIIEMAKRQEEQGIEAD